MIKAILNMLPIRGMVVAAIVTATGGAVWAADVAPVAANPDPGGASVPEGPPRVVTTVPAAGATDVDPATGEIVVTFDRDMARGFSWTGGGSNYPPMAAGEKPFWRDPRTTELRVTFSVPMGAGWSWTGGGAGYPALRAGENPRWTEDQRTCILPVRLEPNRQYRLGLNSPSHRNFQSAAGVPLEPVGYTFQTGP